MINIKTLKKTFLLCRFNNWILERLSNLSKVRRSQHLSCSFSSTAPIMLRKEMAFSCDQERCMKTPLPYSFRNSPWLPHKYQKVQLLELTHHTLDHNCHSKTKIKFIPSVCQLSAEPGLQAQMLLLVRQKSHIHIDSETLSSAETTGNPAQGCFQLVSWAADSTRRCISNTQWTEGLILIRCLRLKSQNWATHLIILVPGEVLCCQDKPILLGATLHDPNVVDGEPALSDDLRGWKQWVLTWTLKAWP